MSIMQHVKRAEKVVTDNSPLILTVVGVAGTIGTAVLAAKASFKAAKLIEVQQTIEDTYQDNNHPHEPYDQMGPVEKAKLVWPLYIPTVVSGCATVAAIVTLNHIGTRRAAALAAAYAVSDRAFTEYKEKVREIVGEKKEEKVRDSLAQDRLDANPVSRNQVIITSGDVLCYESYTGRYFMSDAESIRRAENKLNSILINDGFASLGELYDELGLPRTSDCEDLGWNTDKLLDLSVHGGLAEDNRPCLVVEYTVAPIREYKRFH